MTSPVPVSRIPSQYVPGKRMVGVAAEIMPVPSGKQVPGTGIELLRKANGSVGCASSGTGAGVAPVAEMIPSTPMD